MLFYPRNVVPVQRMLWWLAISSRCLSVIQVGIVSKWPNGSSSFLASTLGLPYIVLTVISRISVHVLFLGTLLQTLFFQTILYSAMTRHQHKCYQLSLTMNSSRLSHWAFTFYEQHDGWHIVHHAGLSVVAETCKILLQTTCHCSWTTDSIISYVLTFGSDNNSPLRISIPYIYSRLATNTHINSGVNKLSCLLFSC